MVTKNILDSHVLSQTPRLPFSWSLPNHAVFRGDSGLTQVATHVSVMEHSMKHETSSIVSQRERQQVV